MNSYSIQENKLSASQVDSIESSGTESDKEEVDELYDNVMQSIQKNQTLTKNLEFQINQIHHSKRMSSLLNKQQIKALNSLMEPLLNRQIKKYSFNQKMIILMQSFFRMKFYMKQYKLKVKKARYRHNVLKELINTEKVYVQDLQSVQIHLFYQLKEALPTMPFQEDTLKSLNEILDQWEIIKKTNEIWLQVLEQRMANYYYLFAFFKDLSTNYISTFESYFQFCQRFQYYLDTIKNAKRISEKFREIIQKSEKNPIFRCLDLASLIVKPIQRLPKYILLLKDYLKHTPEDHPDYQNINSSLEKFEFINEENNTKLNNYIHLCKLQELDKLIEQDTLMQVEIVKENRTFKMEETLNIIDESIVKSVIVYFFSDLILVTERDGISNKLIKYIQLDGLSFCKSVEEKYLSFLFSVKSKNVQIRFQCENKDHKKKIMEQINCVIKEQREKTFKNPLQVLKLQQTDSIQEQKQIFVQVTTLGTETRNQESTYTIYIIEVEIATYKKKLFLRYSEIRELKLIVQKQFGIKNLPQLKIKFNSSKTKIIEFRKRLTEDFLQQILNEPIIQEKGISVLNFLGLPEDIFEILLQMQSSILFRIQPQTQSFDDAKYCNRITKSLGGLGQHFDEYNSTAQLLTLKKQVDQNQMKKGNKIMLRKTKTLNVVPFTIQIIFSDEKSISLEIDSTYIAKQVLKIIKQKIKIKDTIDFSLYYKEHLVMKILDADTYIYKLQEKQFYFLKRLILKSDFEEGDFNNDAARLRLVVLQILKEIKQCHYQLKFIEYCMMSCINIYLKKCDLYPLEKKEKVPKEVLQMTIPDRIFKRYELKIWVENIIQIFGVMNGEIQKFLTQQNEGKGLFESIICVIFMNQIRKCRYFGVTYYQGELYSQTLSALQKLLNQKWNEKVVIGVKHDGIFINGDFASQQEKFLSYEKLTEIKVFPVSIVFKFSDIEFDLRINTIQSYEISQLINEYKDVKEIISYVNELKQST